MRITFFVLFTTVSQILATNLYSQNTRLNLNMKNAEIKDVLQEIESRTQYFFMYNAAQIDVAREINIQCKDMSVPEILEILFHGTNVVYEVNNRQIALSILRGSSLQQVVHITGKVTDSSGTPLPGVTVVVKGTTNGIVTDMDGKYSLSKVTSNATLVFSFVGMKTQEVSIAGKSVINVTLEEDAIGIEEVVAIGYGTVKKRDLTGSVSGVSAEKFQEQAVYSVENALVGRIAGVKVTDAAQPGAGASIQIRGANSMLGGTEPLYVVDGIPVEPNQDAQGNDRGSSQNSSINFINPSSIEKVEVLKDASATAIYGARGANGVVIITTKQGKAGNRELTFKYTNSVSQVSRHRDILDGPGFANFINMAAANLSYLKSSWWNYQQELLDNGAIDQLPVTDLWGGDGSSENISFTWKFDGVEKPLPNSQDLNNTDWQDEIFQTAVTHNYNVGFSGGSDKGTFSCALDYLDQEGVLLGSSYERINAILNLRYKVTEKVTAFSRMNLTKGNANALMTNNGHVAHSLITKTLQFAPTNSSGGDISFEDFDFNDVNYQDIPTDIATKYIDDKEQINMLGSFGLDYKILKGLTLNVTGALTYNANNRDSYYPMSTHRGEASKGDASSSHNQFFKSLMQYQASYNKRFNDKHSINAVVVHTYENFQYRDEFIQVKNFPSDNLTYKNLASGLDYAVPKNYFYDAILKSYLGRVNYGLLDKYMFTVSFRADGSSRFAKNNKWGYFPSGAFAWRMIEEPFIKELNAFSNLKLRLSYGKTGGQAIQPYQSLATLITKNYTFDGGIASGFIENNLENPDLRWEKTDQYNAGIDFGFVKNRINLTLDAYYKKTEDLLMLVDNPPSSGFASKIANVGSVENRGLEAELSATILDKELKWKISANMAINKNKVLSMGKNGFQYSSFSTGGYAPIIFKEGEALGAFIGYEKVKVFENWAEVLSSAQPGSSVGDMMYKDQNSDGTINADDAVIIGNPNPDALWGITNEFAYKNFDFSILIDGQIGGDIYSIEDMTLEANFRERNATVHAAENSWVPAGGLPSSSWELSDGTIYSTEGYDYGFGNSDAYTARPMYNLMSSTRFPVSDEYVYDASFIKIRNISLGYNLNPAKLRSAGIKSLRLYVSGTNLLTITKYDGFDPEVTAFNNNPSRRGLDFGTYPASRTFTFGIQAKF